MVKVVAGGVKVCVVVTVVVPGGAAVVVVVWIMEVMVAFVAPELASS